MPLSYRNIIDGNQIAAAVTSGDFSKVLKKNGTSARYIKGYAQNSAIEALANSLNINKGLFKQVYGLEDKKLDDYDPYHIRDAKGEEFWYSSGQTKIDGKTVQSNYDKNTDAFKRSLYKDFGFRQGDYWYEDPFFPSFELIFNEDSPFFAGGNNDNLNNAAKNSLKYFIRQYMEIDPMGYDNRLAFWQEFNNIFFKIFNSESGFYSDNSNSRKKQYYVSKIAGLQHLLKKFITYGEDKITITINEDISLIGWYLSELYRNIAYSYRNQRYAVPENLLRFDLTIRINDIRNFVIPKSMNQSAPYNPVDSSNIINKDIQNVISPKSQMIFTLHDCNFNFFESKSFGDDMEIGGWGSSTSSSYVPQSLTFDIYFKSVTRWSEFPLISNSYSINPWEPSLSTPSTKQEYYSDLDRVKSAPPQDKGYLNQMLSKTTQNVSNTSLNYMDNLEAKLREVRGGVVNELLTQFRNFTTINKIEPDNVYNPDFNNRTSFENYGRQLASGLLNDLENNIREGTNF
jgi:hypothetical protein